MEQELGVIVDDKGKRRGSLNGIVEGGIADEVRVTVAGCALCHTGRVAGKVYRGLGNKTIDVWNANRVLHRVMAANYPALLFPRRPMLDVERVTNPSFGRYTLISRAIALTGRMAYEPWASRTRGLVPDGLVMWWFLGHNNDKMEEGAPRGEVKVPALWGFATRRGLRPGPSTPDAPYPVPLFADGFAHGRGLLAGAELGADPHPATLGYKGYKQRAEQIATLLAGLVGADGPPAFPCSVDQKLSEAGKVVFAERCQDCHGDHSGISREAPKIKAIGVVGTDPERLRIAAASDFSGGARCAPGAFCERGRAAVDAVAAVDSRRGIERSRWRPEPGGVAIGYFAPRLDGIWARFPYLHNGSVPTLWHLLGPVAERPVAFDLTEASTVAGFDPVMGGLSVPGGKATCTVDPDAFPTGADRLEYCTERTGQSNIGHDFWWRPGGDPLSDGERTAVIEYLKTLGGGVQNVPEQWCAGKGS
ncbi:MAG: hypothetical protein Q8P18_01720 [Pseudomonadota bacterium]|nr:hypothetical protein [Pseudomonadota bacterium]